MAKAKAPRPTGAAEGSPASVVRQVGATVRRLRASHGLTLGEVARRSNISAAMLSRLENGDVSPSLETLGRADRAHWAFRCRSCSATSASRAAARSTSRRARASRSCAVARSAATPITCSPRIAGRAARSNLFSSHSTTRARCSRASNIPGTEFIYLLEGSLTYRHGDETYLLKAGDSLTFAGEVPHGPEKLIKTPIRMLSVIIYAEP